MSGGPFIQLDTGIILTFNVTGIVVANGMGGIRVRSLRRIRTDGTLDRD